MARIVEGLEDSVESSEFGRFKDYPFDEWTDGKIREVKHGEDFSVSVATFRVYLYQWKDLMNHKQVPTPDDSVENWAVRTRIVAPGVIRFYFEPDDQ